MLSKHQKYDFLVSRFCCLVCLTYIFDCQSSRENWSKNKLVWRNAVAWVQRRCSLRVMVSCLCVLRGNTHPFIPRGSLESKTLLPFRTILLVLVIIFSDPAARNQSNFLVSVSSTPVTFIPALRWSLEISFVVTLCPTKAIPYLIIHS